MEIAYPNSNKVLTGPHKRHTALPQPAVFILLFRRALRGVSTARVDGMKAAAGDLSSPGGHCWGVGAIVLLDVPGAEQGRSTGGFSVGGFYSPARKESPPRLMKIAGRLIS